VASDRNRPTVLVVDDDEVLLQVFSRVLARAGYDVLPAGTVAEALQKAESAPDLGLLDLALPDGNGVDLAHSLHTLTPRLPLVLMTAYPPRLAEHPELGQEFVRVLTKPVNLAELHQVLQDILAEGPAKKALPTPKIEPAAVSLAATPPPHPAVPKVQDVYPAASRLRTLRSVGLMGLVVAVIVFVIAFVAGVPLPGLTSAHEEKTVPPPPPLAVELLPDPPHTLRVPEDVRIALGIRKGKADTFAVAAVPAASRALVLSGSTALDPTRLMRIRVRFTPAEVFKIEQARFPSRTPSGQTEFRELRAGDAVEKGQVLAVVYSTDVGQKKNDLIDALVQLKLDEAIQQRAEEYAASLPEVFRLNLMRNVEADRNAIARSLNTLKLWGIPPEDIDAVYKEAEEIGKRKGKRNESKQEQWARVELKAPDAGIIVERNVAVHEVIVDNTLNLFQIAKVGRLLVQANAPEDDLPTLLKLTPDQKRWTVRPLARDRDAPRAAGIPGTIDDISYLIDINQHNAVVKGHIDNPEGKLRGGQFVSCTVQLPPPPDVVEVPMSAIVDDGRQCVAFVQTDPNEPHYTMRRVEVRQRFDKTAFVRSRLADEEMELTPEEKEMELLPRRPLRPGERLLTAGVLELKRELEDRESKAAK
jgi:cobalt-zinc-cadmium efflux system membrane fusion protein